MSIGKDHERGTYYLLYYYRDWTGERKKKSKGWNSGVRREARWLRGPVQRDLLRPRRSSRRYRSRYEGARFFFPPDYSLFGDASDLEEHYRLLKARIVGIGFAIELGVVVVPFITAPTPESVGFALDGLEYCSVVAFSTKGYVNDPFERNVIKELVRLTVDTLDLKAIVVYDVCSTNDAVDDIFSYATERGVKIVVPPNALKERNAAKREKRHAKQ